MLVLAVEFMRFRPPLALRAWTRRAVGDPCSATNGGPTTTAKNSKKIAPHPPNRGTTALDGRDTRQGKKPELRKDVTKEGGRAQGLVLALSSPQ